jgi:dihydrodipicolinate synthase/N-acetylneuraminate lyase
VHEPDAQGHVRAEALARQEPAPGSPRADPGEHERRDDRGDDSEPDLGEAEDCVRGGDRDVGTGDEAAASPEGVAVHERDHGGRAPVDRLTHAVEAHRVLDVLLVREVDRRALPVDVGAGAEALALAGENDGTRVSYVREGIRQLGDESGVEGIAPLRAGQRHPQDGPVPLDAERAHDRELKVAPMIHGALAAAVTPLREDGAALDEDAFEPYLGFLAEAGLDGILALGTTGEGILLSLAERRRAAELFIGAADGRLEVAVHCGAQTTADTVALAEHAAGAGAQAVAVIGPPYFRLDAKALLDHFRRSAAACAPTPFYLYEFEAASGYPIPLEVVDRLRDETPNLAGLKVSDSPFEKVRPYLVEGLDVFVGAEALLDVGLAAGAAGAVSGLAAAFPAEVAAVVEAPSPQGAGRLGELRAGIERFPRHAALKLLIGRRGVPVREDVRAPLRGLDPSERAELLEWLG